MKNKHSYNQYLIEALQDTNMGVRFSAAGLALMKIGDKNVLQALKKQSGIDKRKTVRHVLRGIVREMNQENYLTLQ